jgi:hypothetical protein
MSLCTRKCSGDEERMLNLYFNRVSSEFCFSFVTFENEKLIVSSLHMPLLHHLISLPYYLLRYCRLVGLLHCQQMRREHS